VEAGLRIDVDTLRGTKLGVARLCQLLARHRVRASFFFSVGPDNMGRHLWRLARPAFAWKMLRTRAARLYGWDILWRGTFWPGPVIGQRLAPVIRATADAGHEVGLHAWDHYQWQAHLDSMEGPAIRRCLERGVDVLTGILGRPPTCSAAPAWRCDDRVLREKARLPFAYNSDCRGQSPFYPVVDGTVLSQPQVPVTLPTYDERIGRDGVTEDNYNDSLLSLIRPDRLNVLTIHAEVEGMACMGMFDAFLQKAQSRGVAFVPLGTVLASAPMIGHGTLIRRETPGREGWLAYQAPLDAPKRPEP